MSTLRVLAARNREVSEKWRAHQQAQDETAEWVGEDMRLLFEMDETLSKIIKTPGKTCADIVIKLDELIEYVWLDPEIIHDILTALKTRGARAALFQFPRFRHTIEGGPFSGVPHVVEFLDSIKKDLIRVSGAIL